MDNLSASQELDVAVAWNTSPNVRARAPGCAVAGCRCPSLCGGHPARSNGPLAARSRQATPAAKRSNPISAPRPCWTGKRFVRYGVDRPRRPCYTTIVERIYRMSRAMSHRMRMSRCLTALAVLAYLAGIALQWSPHVLCIGHGGDVAVEVAVGDSCQSLQATRPDGDGVKTPREDESWAGRCGSCVDVPLSAGRAAPHLSPPVRGAAPVPVAALPVAAGDGLSKLRRLTAGHARHPDDAPPPFLTSLRTTVLLI